MVLPTWAACRLHASLFWPWTFASLYILLLATIYGLRFRQGRWKTMRVIESKDEATAAAPVAVEPSFLVPPSTLP
jgi:hypothetical protein